MPPDVEAIERALADLPTVDKLTLLVASLIVDDAAETVKNLVEATTALAKRLPPNERCAASNLLREAALEVRWQYNRIGRASACLPLADRP